MGFCIFRDQKMNPSDEYERHKKGKKIMSDRKGHVWSEPPEPFSYVSTEKPKRHDPTQVLR